MTSSRNTTFRPARKSVKTSHLTAHLLKSVLEQLLGGVGDFADLSGGRGIVHHVVGHAVHLECDLEVGREVLTVGGRETQQL